MYGLAPKKQGMVRPPLGPGGGNFPQFGMRPPVPSGGLVRPTIRAPVPPVGPVDYGNTYGLNESFLQTLGINCKLTSRIYVNNVSTKFQILTLGSRK